ILNGGTLGGSGAFTITGTGSSLSSGSMTGTGTTNLASGASASILNIGLTRTFNSDGNVTLSGVLRFDAGGVFNNHAGATFDAENATGLGNGFGTGPFNNAGTFIK